MKRAKTGRVSLNRSLLLGWGRVDLLIVDSRHGGNLSEASTGLRFCIYDPTQGPPLWCLRFWLLRVFAVRDLPREIRTLVSITRTLKIRAVLATDAYSALADAEGFLGSTDLYWVQHGLFLDQRGSEIKRELDRPDRESSITLFATSPYDLQNYRRWGVRPRTIIPVGTFKNSSYLMRLKAKSPSGTKAFDICIVEKGIKPNPDSELGLLRRESWRELLNHLNAYCQQNSARVILALSQSTDQKAVLEWIQSVFTHDFELADPNDDFSTYEASDQSELTIGQASTVLCESLSRQCKILAVNYSNIKFWDLPGKGLTQMNSPSRDRLFNRIDSLRTMTWNEYWRQTPEALKQLTVTDPKSAITTAARHIQARLAK